MKLFYLGVSTFITSELMLRLPLPCCLQRIILSATKAASILRSSRISDEWKEKSLPAYAMKIAVNSALLFVLMMAAVSPFILLRLFMPEDFTVTMMHPDVLIGITVLGIGWVSIRRLSLCRTTP